MSSSNNNITLSIKPFENGIEVVSIDQDGKNDGVGQLANQPRSILDNAKELSKSQEEAPLAISTDVSDFQTTEGDGDMYSTPRKVQRITLERWEDVSLSPTSLVQISLAKKRMIEDGYTSEIMDQMPRKVFRCTLFLYGIGYRWEGYSKTRRLAAISEITNSENIDRLSDIAFAKNPFTIMIKSDAILHTFVNMVVPFLALPPGKILGGFPTAPFVRFQKSKNCFLPAVVSMISLNEQSHRVQCNDDGEHRVILDVRQVARRWLVNNHKDLDKRVKENNGKNAERFFEHLLAKKGNFTFHKLSSQTSELRPEPIGEFAQMVQWRFNGYQHGLVVGFGVHENFREAGKGFESIKNMGFWKFDGDSVDCKGEFCGSDSADFCAFEVDMEQMAQKKQELVVALRQEREKLLEQSRAHQMQLNEKLGEPSKVQKPVKTTDTEETDDTLPKVKTTDTEETDDTLPKHAMVLLAVIKGNLPENDLYVLLNSWTHLPLVAVSPSYMRACNGSILFPSARVLPLLNSQVDLTTTSMVECSSPEFCDDPPFGYPPAWDGFKSDDDDDAPCVDPPQWTSFNVDDDGGDY